MVAPWGRGQGLAVRATQLLSTWALAQGMSRIELRAAAGNDASLRTARAAGFTEEGVLRQAGVTHAGPVDLVVFSRLASDDPSNVDPSGRAAHVGVPWSGVDWCDGRIRVHEDRCP